MDQVPVNSIDNNSNTIRVNDNNTPIKLTFKYVDGSIINLKDKIDYFYLTKDDDNFYSVTDITFEGDELIFKLPNLIKGLYRVEIRDIEGSIYPADDSLFILLKRSFEEGKESYYTSYREDILNNVEPIIIQHIEQNPDKFRGERGQQGFPGRDGLPGIDGQDGKDGIDGEKGDPGRDGSMSFVDLTPEEKEQLRGERGRPGLDGKDGIDGINGIDGLPGRDGIDGKDGRDGIDGKDGSIDNKYIGVKNLIDISSFIKFGQTLPIDTYNIEKGIINFDSLTWQMFSYQTLNGVKHAFRVKDYSSDPQYYQGLLRFRIIEVIDGVDGDVLIDLSVPKNKVMIVDLSGRETQKYRIELRPTGGTALTGFIEKPMLVEGDIPVLWHYEKELNDIVIKNHIKKYIPDDYSSLTEAFNDLLQYKPGNNVTYEIIFKSGFKPSRGVYVSNGDFSHFIISSEDDILEVSNSFTGHFLSVTNASAPVLNTLVDMKGLGSDGVRVHGGSRGMVNPQCGCINAGETGLYVRTSTFQAPYSKFYGCKGRNVWVTRASNVSVPNSDLSNPSGDRVGVYVSRSSILDASEANISGGTAEYANIQVLRSKATLLGATINNAKRDGVVAGSGSEITLRGGDISHAGGSAIRASGGSTIHLGDNIDLSNAGEYGIHASYNSLVSGTNVKATLSGKHGVFSKTGSIVTVPGVNASNCIESGLYAIDGGTIIASDSENSSEYRSYINFNGSDGFYCGLGSQIVLKNVKISNNKGSGGNVISAVKVTLNETTIENNSKKGLYVNGSDLLIRVNSSVKGNTEEDLYLDLGAKVIAQGTPTTNSPSVSPLSADSNISGLNVIDGRKGIIFA